MQPIQKALRKSLILCVILTLCLPLGGAMMGVGFAISQPAVWGIGIGLLALGFYGTAIGWALVYAPKKALYRELLKKDREGAQLGIQACLTLARMYEKGRGTRPDGRSAERLLRRAMELLGRSVTDKAGKVWPCLGLADFATVETDKRAPEDVIAHTSLWDAPAVGFMNKCGATRGVETPLLTGLAMGFGNEAEKGPEGFHWKNVFASELTGPILVKNPRLLDAIAAAICARRGLPLPEEKPSFPYAEAGYAITAEQLKLRAEAKQ